MSQEVVLGQYTAGVSGGQSVTGYLDEGDFAAVLGATTRAQDAAERLVAEAIQRGGADNATAVVVRRLT